MAHNHGNEYQVRIVHEDGTEELSGWMNSEEQLAQAMAAVHRAQGKAYWLRERNVLCPDCFDKEQGIIVECPITDIPSRTWGPHEPDSSMIQVIVSPTIQSGKVKEALSALADLYRACGGVGFEVELDSVSVSPSSVSVTLRSIGAGHAR